MVFVIVGIIDVLYIVVCEVGNGEVFVVECIVSDFVKVYVNFVVDFFGVGGGDMFGEIMDLMECMILLLCSVVILYECMSCSFDVIVTYGEKIFVLIVVVFFNGWWMKGVFPVC